MGCYNEVFKIAKLRSLKDFCPYSKTLIFQAISKAVYKGMLSLLKAFIHGLETTFQNYGLGGMASAYMVLEIAHTHCWTKEHVGSNKSDTSLTPEVSFDISIA